MLQEFIVWFAGCCTWGGTTGVDHAVAVNSWGTRLIWPGPLGTCGSGATSDRGSQTVLSVSDDMAPLHDQHASLFTPLFCSLHGRSDRGSLPSLSTVELSGVGKPPAAGGTPFRDHPSAREHKPCPPWAPSIAAASPPTERHTDRRGGGAEADLCAVQPAHLQRVEAAVVGDDRVPRLDLRAAIEIGLDGLE